MNITARNYAAQAVASLQQQAFILKTNNKHNDYLALDFVINEIKQSVHFAIPDGGKIFDDNKKGIQNSKINTPYNAITIEWYTDYFERNFISSENHTMMNKKLILAIKPKSFYEFLLPTVFFYFYYHNYYKTWCPVPFYLLIPDDTVIPDQNKCIRDKFLLECTNGIWLPNYFDSIENKQQQKIIDEMKKSILGNVWLALELFEALSCSNVSHEPIETIDPRKNAKRIKAGKLPIYETRILTIQAGKASSSSKIYGGTHASPRQHLRRGHIRRLEDKKIWVNACVVGKPENGVIDKNYHVKKYNHASA